MRTTDDFFFSRRVARGVYRFTHRRSNDVFIAREAAGASRDRHSNNTMSRVPWNGILMCEADFAAVSLRISTRDERMVFCT